jgi:Zn-finger nucleic acid-binding protein
LDRGELDKIIERSTVLSPELEHRPPFEPDYDDDKYHQARYPRKRKSFLSEIFDFD